MPRIYPLTDDPPAMNIFSYSSTDFVNPTARAKRRQVKNACTNCQRACKKCDDARPCLRCVKYGVSEECVDSQRKERKKGVKRGPYKKRDGRAAPAETASNVSSDVAPAQQLPQYLPLAAAYPPYYPPPYPPQDKPVEGTTGMLYAPPPYYLAAVQHQHEVEYQQQQQPGSFYQAGAIYHAGPYYTMPCRQVAPLHYPLHYAPQKQGPVPHEILPNSSH